MKVALLKQLMRIFFLTLLILPIFALTTTAFGQQTGSPYLPDAIETDRDLPLCKPGVYLIPPGLPAAGPVRDFNIMGKKGFDTAPRPLPAVHPDAPTWNWTKNMQTEPASRDSRILVSKH